MTMVNERAKQTVNAALVVMLAGWPNSATAQDVWDQALQGSPACACIDPWVGYWDDGQNRDITLERDTATGSAATTVSLQPGYGGGSCQQWDIALENMCIDSNGHPPAAGQPAWCESKWCYVNATTCERPHRLSALDWQSYPVPPTGLTYSYETCGNVDTYFQDTYLYNALRGKHLRVSSPALVHERSRLFPQFLMMGAARRYLSPVI